MAPQSGNRIELELPTQPLLLFMARMIAGAVATHARFPHDQVDDFRLAVDELILTLTRGRDMEKTLHLDLEWDDGLVEAVATLHERGAIHSLRVGDRSTGGEDTAGEFSESILTAIVDQHESAALDQAPIAWLRVRRQDPCTC